MEKTQKITDIGRQGLLAVHKNILHRNLLLGMNALSDFPDGDKNERRVQEIHTRLGI